MEQKPIIMFTDGSSRGNPGPGGWGAVISFPDDIIVERGGREDHTTNNRMELQAIIDSLIYIRNTPGDVLVYTDSSYAIQGISKWVHGWIKNGWMTSTKTEVINKDLWELLTSIMYERERTGKVIWKHVSGHNGIAGNERVDEIATAFADKKEIELYEGPASGYEIDIMNITSTGVKKVGSKEKKARAKQKAYSYVSYIEGKIETYETWAECEKAVKGIKGAKFKKAVSAEDEAEVIKELKK